MLVRTRFAKEQQDDERDCRDNACEDEAGKRRCLRTRLNGLPP